MTFNSAPISSSAERSLAQASFLSFAGMLKLYVVSATGMENENIVV